MAQRPGLLVLFAFLALFLATAACGGNEPGVVRGVVVEVMDRNLAEIETLRIRDEKGQRVDVRHRWCAGKERAHLRLHQVLGETIEVSYDEREGRLVATALRD